MLVFEAKMSLFRHKVIKCGKFGSLFPRKQTFSSKAILYHHTCSFSKGTVNAIEIQIEVFSKIMKMVDSMSKFYLSTAPKYLSKATKKKTKKQKQKQKQNKKTTLFYGQMDLSRRVGQS